MYSLIKTHESGNLARVITNGCSTAIEKLSIFIETILFDLANDLPSRIRDTEHMLNKLMNLTDGICQLNL